MLFEPKPRTRTDYMKKGENKFAFFDVAAKGRFEPYRRLVNEWVSLMPEDARKEAVDQLKGGDPFQYDAGIVELMIYRVLVGLGHDVVVHPTVNGHCPDFLVRNKDGSPAAYVEVTTTNPSRESVAAQNRRNDLINGLNKIDLPAGWIGSVFGVHSGASAPSPKAFRNAIEAWSRSVGPDRSQDFSKVFVVGDWKVDFRLHPANSADFKPERSVSVEYTGLKDMKPAVAVRQALERKGDRYGIRNVPFLLAVADGREEIHDDGFDFLLEALYGDEQIVGTRNGFYQDRANNGYFGQIGDPRHSHVSAVLLLPSTNFMNLYQEHQQPTFIVNPDARCPLPREFLPLNHYEFDAARGRFERRAGRPMTELLGMPSEEWWDIGD